MRIFKDKEKGWMIEFKNEQEEENFAMIPYYVVGAIFILVMIIGFHC